MYLIDNEKYKTLQNKISKLRKDIERVNISQLTNDVAVILTEIYDDYNNLISENKNNGNK